MTNTHSRTGLDLDEVHSFVLRVSIDRARGGGGAPRPQFQLEHVNSRRTCRTRTLQEACAALESQVRSIFDQLGYGGVTNPRE